MTQTFIAPANDADSSAAPLSVELLRAQKQSLEMVVRGRPLRDVLDYLVRVVEAHAAEDAVAAILLLEKGRLVTGAAPSLPADYNAAIDGLRPAPEIGTCARAAAIGEVVLTPDIAADARWQSLKHMPLGLGLVAAWSQPILGSGGQVLGTFGTYFRRTRGPTAIERLLVETLSHTAALAIERAQREAERELLVDELNHRVKNTLAVVQSIAAHTLRSAPDPGAFAAAFTDRIAALARAHSLLANHLWKAARIGDVVEACLAPFTVDGRSAIRQAGPDARIDTGVAVALTLVLHELATNASKYGALSDQAGEVSVSWEIAADGEAPARARFAWREHGGPAVRVPTVTGFGSRLINASAGQLGGPVALRFEPEGVRCELSLPLAS